MQVSVFLYNEINPLYKLILSIAIVIVLSIMLYYMFKLIEMAYVFIFKRPLYNHLYFQLRSLPEKQKQILAQKFSFYKKLNQTQKAYFEHRMVCFLKEKDFIAKENIEITDEIKVLISATAIMLTFGFRDFYIGLISEIVVYPYQFYSIQNKSYHKGEFNPKTQKLSLSWEDFKSGFSNQTDNINLGIHEFAHAIHFSSIRSNDVSAVIFNDTYNKLLRLLENDKVLYNKILNTPYFRKYAHTNQFEFLAVLIENFIETPHDFKIKFPFVYSKIKQMLNFRFSGYP